MNRHYLIGTSLTLAVVAMLASAFSAAATPDALIVYNAQHESLTQVWVDGFPRETEIPVVLRTGSDSGLPTQFAREGSASPADVFLPENSPAMVLVENAGLFAAVDSASLGQVPA